MLRMSRLTRAEVAVTDVGFDATDDARATAVRNRRRPRVTTPLDDRQQVALVLRECDQVRGVPEVAPQRADQVTVGLAVGVRPARSVRVIAEQRRERGRGASSQRRVEVQLVDARRIPRNDPVAPAEPLRERLTQLNDLRRASTPSPSQIAPAPELVVVPPRCSSVQSPQLARGRLGAGPIDHLAFTSSRSRGLDRALRNRARRRPARGRRRPALAFSMAAMYSVVHAGNG